MSSSSAKYNRVVDSILANHPITLEEDKVCRRRPFDVMPWVSTLIPGLSDDVVRSILVGLPRSDWLHLRLVCKAWKTTLEEPAFYHRRVELGITEEWCYTEAWHSETKLVSWFAFDPSQKKWLALPPVPREKGSDVQIFGRASTVVKGELFVIGGQAGELGPTLSDMYIFSPFNLRWRKGKSMIITRHNPLMFAIFDTKIYVLGGFDSLNNQIDSGEVYDVDEGEWTIVGNDGNPQLICPARYHKGWQLQWTRFLFNRNEHHIVYHTKDHGMEMKYYIPRKGAWGEVEFRGKTKTLLRYGFGCVVNMHIILLDWANARIRYTYHPNRSQGWKKIPGLADLNWVKILITNPKVIGLGSKLALVGRGLSMLLIETNPILLEAKDGCFIDSIPCETKALLLEPIGCAVVAA